MNQILFFLFIILLIFLLASFSKDLNFNYKNDFVNLILLPFFLTIPELILMVHNLINKQPYLVTSNIVGSILLLFLFLSISILINIKKEKINISNKLIYITALIIYGMIIVINAFNKSYLVIMNINLSSFIIIIVFIIYLIFSVIGSDINIKKSLNYKTSLKIFVVIIGFYVLTNLINRYNYGDLIKLNFLMIPILFIIPKLIFLLKENKYHIFLGSIMYNYLYLALYDILYKNESVYFYANKLIIWTSKNLLYLLIVFFGYLVYQKKYPFIIKLLFSMIVIVTYFYIILNISWKRNENVLNLFKYKGGLIMDLFVILVLVFTALFFYRKFNKMVYSIVIIDILLRIVDFLKQNITSQELYKFLNKNIPISIPNLIDRYTSGVFNEILIWAYVILYIVFIYYTFRIFLKKK